MEPQQRPPKRARNHSSSSASDVSQPTKTRQDDQNADQLDPQQPPEKADAQESHDSNESSGEEDPQNQDGSEKGSPSNNNNSKHTSPELNNQESSSTQPVDQSDSTSTHVPPVVYSNGDWQAVYDAASNAYYFANVKTGETTWTNPMVPSSEATSTRPLHSQQAIDLGGIDPELARLDPHFSRILHGHSSSTEPRFAARFNAKTGRFESDPSHDPSRVSEFARARTQTEAFFDVAGWEKSLETHNGRIPGTSKEARAAAIEKGKKLTKAQLEQFKKQKMEKKARNQRAWLIGSK